MIQTVSIYIVAGLLVLAYGMGFFFGFLFTRVRPVESDSVIGESWYVGVSPGGKKMTTTRSRNPAKAWRLLAKQVNDNAVRQYSRAELKKAGYRVKVT